MKKVLFALIAALFVSVATPLSRADDSKVTVISVSDSSVVKLTRYELRSLYLMKTRYSTEGVRLTLFQFPYEDPVHIKFVRDVLEMNVSEYNRELARINNTGTSTNNVVIAKSKTEMIRLVASTYNSIGYLDSLTFLINFGESDVKKVLIVD